MKYTKTLLAAGALMAAACISCQNAESATNPPADTSGQQPPTQPPPPPVTPPTASKLSFVTQPAASTAGASIAPAMEVAVQDASGTTVPGATTIVTLTITAGTGASGAALVGTASASAVNGIALFNNVKIQKAGTGYTLTASAGSLTAATSSAFDVSPGTAAKLVVQTQPSTVAAGSAISPAVQIAVQDAFGNQVTNSATSVSMAVAAGPVSPLGGTVTQVATNGVATFPDLVLTKASTLYTLTASAPGVASATTGTFSVTAAAAAKLAVTVVPSTATAGAVIVPAVQVATQDAYGNTAAAGASVTIGITSGTGAPDATLSGTVTQTAPSGVALFSNLKIDKVGSGYTFTASASGLTSATSAAFSVVGGSASALAFTAQPTDATAGATISPSVQVTVKDQAGNVVTTPGINVTLGITSASGAPGATLGGVRTRAAVSGIATFDNLTIDKASAGYSLTATATGLSSALSSSFTISAGAAAKLAFSVQPTNVVSSVAISPAVKVSVSDAFNNTVTSATSSITLAITSGTGAAGAVLGGTLTRSAAAGIATFNDLTVDKAGTNFTLTATATGLTNATSATFAVSGGGGGTPSCANPAPGWIWCDDFEVDRLSSYFEFVTDGGSFTRASGAGRNGGFGMRAHFALGQVSAGSLKLAFGRTPSTYFKPVDAGTQDYREIYWRFYFRNQPGWIGGGGDKMTRATVFATSSWAQAMFAHVWSSGQEPDYLLIDPASGTDVSGVLKTTKYNDFANMRWLGSVRSATPIFSSANVGQWYCIESHVRLNTAGLSDGVFEVRINGQLDISKTNLNWLGSYSAYGLNAIMLESYWNAGSAADQERYFDDFVVSTSPIGC